SIVFYGTSIVHGGCASRPGMSYPAILGRRLDRPFINLGFSGNGKMEPEIAALLASLDPAAYVLDALPNMTEPEIVERYVWFVQTLRAARPTAPLVLVDAPTYCAGWLRPDSRARTTGPRASFAAVAEQLRNEGISFHVVNGDVLFGPDGDATVDGVHP